MSDKNNKINEALDDIGFMAATLFKHVFPKFVLALTVGSMIHEATGDPNTPNAVAEFYQETKQDVVEWVDNRIADRDYHNLMKASQDNPVLYMFREQAGTIDAKADYTAMFADNSTMPVSPKVVARYNQQQSTATP